jgi:hypothetical protein
MDYMYQGQVIGYSVSKNTGTGKRRQERSFGSGEEVRYSSFFAEIIVGIGKTILAYVTCMRLSNLIALGSFLNCLISNLYTTTRQFLRTSTAVQTFLKSEKPVTYLAAL